MGNEHILLVGGTMLDTKGKPTRGLVPHTSNPGFIRSTRGGTARNVAENLARFGADVVLMSAVGDDATGRQLLAQTAVSGVNIEYVQTIAGENSGAYIALLDPDGDLSIALDDVRVMRHITPEYIYRNRRLFRDAQMVLVDGSLTKDALATAVRLCQKYNTPLCADPSSTRLAHRLCPYIPDLSLVVPNEAEAAELCGVIFQGNTPEANMNVARQLVQLGVEIAVITMSDYGLAFATFDETGYLPANYTEKVDSTGSGDAVTAAIIFGLINDLSPVEAIRLGAAAGNLTLQTSETVVPDLSLDMLYEHLIV
ncbi:MAG: carbohydrate kinase family protein [Chloroflexota bacterium]